MGVSRVWLEIQRTLGTTGPHSPRTASPLPLPPPFLRLPRQTSQLSEGGEEHKRVQSGTRKMDIASTCHAD